MDNHPIPQDVTGFQFRLIGDMTIKQFAYLAAGVILGWIMLATPLFFFLKFLLAAIFAGIGALLAFVPIGGRPADAMLLFFLKAIFSPTQYVYQQTGSLIQQPPSLTTVVGETQKEHSEKKEEKKQEKVLLQANPVALSQSVLQPHPQDNDTLNQSGPITSHIAMVTPSIAPISQEKEQTLAKEEATVSKALQEARQEETTTQGTSQEKAAHEKVAQLEKDMQDILAQKELLEKQLFELQKQLSQKQDQVFTPSVATAQPAQTVHVRKIPTSQSTSVGTPFVNDVPNLITGVIKDPRGNVVPNILIEVKDKDNNPVRAFKTNPLGQFASATPILNGTYTITFEDPLGKHKFDTIEITATGEVMLPLEVISTDAREELRQELFGTPMNT